MNAEKQTHTPGPWTMYANSPDADGSECLPSIMARNPLGDGLFYVAQANLGADASLIAAAPDLLAACEGLLSIYDRYTGVGMREADTARAAIAKASGAESTVHLYGDGSNRKRDWR